mmetsp:Transcript_19891/g.61557  ORF Transcript_19891/g.61557 Transcript_19891/m.61557 type:complete len:334 (+) Transcript_19891:148-1149(+)
MASRQSAADICTGEVCLEEGREAGEGGGVGDGLVAAVGVAEAEDAAVDLEEVGGGFPGVGTERVLGGRRGRVFVVDGGGLSERGRFGPGDGLQVRLGVPRELGAAVRGGHGLPAAKGAVGEVGVDVVQRGVGQREAVAGDARGDGSEEGVGDGVLAAEEPRTFLGCFLARPGPDGVEALQLSGEGVRDRRLLVGSAQVHGTVASEMSEARVHFGGQRPTDGAQPRVRGPQQVGVPARELLGRGQRVAEHDAVLDLQRRDRLRGGEPQLLQLLRHRAVPEPHHRRLHGQPERLEEQPPAQAPGRVRPVADRKQVLLHASVLLLLLLLLCGSAAT